MNDAAAWREQLLELNSWARALPLREDDWSFQVSRNKAALERLTRGKEAWNAWANGMLAVKRALKTADLWSAKRDGSWQTLAGDNEATQAWLVTARVVYSISFSPHTFKSGASFSDFVFPGPVWFENATFPGGVTFEAATFCDVANFQHATFPDGPRAHHGHAILEPTAFSNVAGLESAPFPGETNTSLHHANFENVTFSHDVWFHQTIFSNYAKFNKATFGGYAGFHEVTFSMDAYFEAEFWGHALFGQATFKGLTSFKAARFRGAADFAAIHSERQFTLEDAVFHQVPDFLQSHFSEVPRFDNVQTPRYRPWGWTSDKDAPARFRELKRRAAEAQDHDRALEFFAQEIRTARFHAKGLPAWVPRFWSWRFWFGLAYGTFSNFGRSFLRPLVVWLALVVGFAVFYLGQHESQPLTRDKPDSIASYVTTARAAWVNPPDCVAPNSPMVAKTNIAQEALFISASNALVVFNLGRGDVSRRTYGCLYGFEASGPQAPPIGPYRVAVASTIQTLLSAILIFLFLLAVRNLLRLK